MKNLKYLAFVLLMLITACKNKKDAMADFELKYPETKRDSIYDEYFGIKVHDPYRWLEDDNSPETEEWVKAQNELTFSYLERIPYRQKIRDRLTKLWDYPKMSPPVNIKGKYFFFKNDGLQNQSVLYYMDKIKGTEKVVVDPNQLSKDGTVALSTFSVSDDGKYIAYAISKAGSDWSEIYVKEIETGKLLNDKIEWIKFSGIAWYNDGFFYSRYPAPGKEGKLSAINQNSKIYYHKLGTKQDADVLIYEDRNNPDISFSPATSDSKKYLIIYAHLSTSGNALYLKDLSKNVDKTVKIVDSFDNDFTVIDEIGNKLYILTNFNAPKYKIIELDLSKPNINFAKDFIPESNDVLQSATFIGGKFILNYTKDAYSKIKIYDSKGKYLYDLDNNEIGTISGFDGEKEDTKTFYLFTSFTNPSTIYMYDINKNKSTVYQKPKVDFNPEQYITKQVFYKSKDGTKIPMFIVHKKGINLDGNNPTILYGYGGFNIQLTPYFSVSRIVWLEQGGIVAIANLRGGGEYGEEWHKAGTLMNKKNVFYDFIAAAEYLINEKYTSAKRLAIQGGSNGGLLVGAVLNMRPDLFAVALPAVGVMDMLRYHKFTIGRFWATDYGTSEDSKEMFEYLYSYSPYHNIRNDVEYPAVFVTTADHDDRVVPAHSFKYIAQLQYMNKGTKPTFIRIETQAGHGAGKPTAKIIDEIADIYAFTFYNMNFTPLYK
ncbi:MAG TPA: prolyl oligopeptidase family serine peptidase [Bacteroidales bacterium]|jgi:prolyl oligopeptidase|nr:prolyl oligopeptidase family serine peptidase [Bacteroidales bacterium]HOL97196.1 prolyl oligopeptidase family serine peptidase [Bacteroidales bacterium]HOM35488.1 prolyl oligopeptidase family serine peptidase [Bacteroidales bacterium]HPD24273.1 prolyl oligopeptidase family serine peptidase [Bacteroidales bacterium]HRS98652.1 prolyl oligopeptidase family serine peptidase [Bacteroidales bacterium]